MSGRRGWVLALLLLAGGCAGRGGKGAAAPKLPPAKPEAVEALKEAARLWRLGSGSLERAVERLREARTIDPGLWEAWYDEGLIELERRRLDAARDALEHALQVLPTHLPSVLALGKTHLLLGQPADAARICRAYLEAGPKTGATPVRVLYAAALRQAGKLDEATSALREALRGDPRSVPALNGLALVYQAKERHELADLVLHRALEVDEKSKAAAETWNNLGLVALARRRDQEAFAHFEQATQLDPTLTVARRNKALVYLDCGDYARAADELKKVTRSDPSDGEAWTALGVAERGRAALDAAVRAFDKAIALDPDGPGALDPLYDLGVLFMDFKKDPERARRHFERFLEISSKHPRRADAEARLKELAAASSPGASSKPGGAS